MIPCEVGPAELERRLAAVRARIEAAGGDPARITVVGVTKGFDASAVRAAAAVGLRDLGESYAQETVRKIADLGPDVPPPRWHWVGRMQRNKVRQVAEHVALWHSVDRASLAAEIARRAPGAAVLVQVNTSGEETKAGCAPGATAALVADARSEGLDVRGLMTMAPIVADPEQARPVFRKLRALREELREAVPFTTWSDLSMGMTDDYPVAIEEGATIIRIGRAIFGPSTY